MVVLGTVSTKDATSNLYPVCKLHKSSWGYGIGGAGVGPAGGTNVITVPASFEYDGAGNVTVTAPAQYAAYTQVVQLSANAYAFSNTDTNNINHLLLTIVKE